jgi:hypothetical protein
MRFTVRSPSAKVPAAVAVISFVMAFTVALASKRRRRWQQVANL